jgi:hypothetical protein
MTIEPKPSRGKAPGRAGLQRVKIAALAAAILVAFCTQASSEQFLSAEEIESRIVGHSFQGRMGILSVKLHYGRDGTVNLRTPFGAGQGSWTQAGNRLCVKLLAGPRKVDECLTFTRLSDGVYRASNGVELTLAE